MSDETIHHCASVDSKIDEESNIRGLHIIIYNPTETLENNIQNIIDKYCKKPN